MKKHLNKIMVSFVISHGFFSQLCILSALMGNFLTILAKDEANVDFKELGMKYPGMWRVPNNLEHCCIYRVPNSMRQVKPEAYTPQLVIIGPLHHSLKSQALKSLGNITDARSMGYLNMEAHKKFYLVEFAKRVEGEKTLHGFRRMIEEDEEKIRESYSESTAWIKSREFVEMILHDSVFILEFMLRYANFKGKMGDPLDGDCLRYTIKEDLIMLENQLPYFILEKLFTPIIPSFRKLVIHSFDLEGYIRNNSTFKHFTDLIRCAHVETLPRRALVKIEYIDHMYSAIKLESGGVEFEAIKQGFSLNVRFENGRLKMPCFTVEDNSEIKLRNIMAFEQCHDVDNAHVCAYIMFLDYLIDTEKDVDLLVEKGIIKNLIGQHTSVAKMVNKLCLGVTDYGSYYPDIANKVNAYYDNTFNKLTSVLKRVYFNNLWTGTATIAAMFLLVMTLIQTVTSINQIKQKASAP